MNAQTQLLARLKSREAVIGIVGLGYVGLPLMLRYIAAGFRVLGFDIDAHKVDQLNDGLSYIEHIPGEHIARAREAGFRATLQFREVSECDALILCVPTPLNEYREPDISYVTSTADAIAPFLRPGQVVSLESTTYPGTTDEEIIPRIIHQGLNIGQDVFVIYSPEREDPGNKHFDTQTIPKVVGGATKACLEVGVALYEQAIDRIVPVSSTKAAELTKLLENIHRAVNIGLVNEMKIVADKMGIDIFEVVDAASTKPFGFTPYYPGPGLGGHCIPIDPFYLTWKARAYGLHTRFIELSGEINQGMPEYVVSKLVDGLNDHGKAVKNSKVLVLGIAYKKNIDDMRESPALEIIKLIRERGAIASYSDPHIPAFHGHGVYDFAMDSVALDAEVVAGYDAVVLATDHDRFDYGVIGENARLLVDSRGRYREEMGNLVKA